MERKEGTGRGGEGMGGDWMGLDGRNVLSGKEG